MVGVSCVDQAMKQGYPIAWGIRSRFTVRITTTHYSFYNSSVWVNAHLDWSLDQINFDPNVPLLFLFFFVFQILSQTCLGVSKLLGTVSNKFSTSIFFNSLLLEISLKPPKRTWPVIKWSGQHIGLGLNTNSSTIDQNPKGTFVFFILFRDCKKNYLRMILPLYTPYLCDTNPTGMRGSCAQKMGMSRSQNVFWTIYHVELDELNKYSKNQVDQISITQ